MYYLYKEKYVNQSGVHIVSMYWSTQYNPKDQPYRVFDDYDTMIAYLNDWFERE